MWILGFHLCPRWTVIYFFVFFYYSLLRSCCFSSEAWKGDQLLPHLVNMTGVIDCTVPCSDTVILELYPPTSLVMATKCLWRKPKGRTWAKASQDRSWVPAMPAWYKTSGFLLKACIKIHALWYTKRSLTDFFLTFL